MSQSDSTTEETEVTNFLKETTEPLDEEVEDTSEEDEEEPKEGKREDKKDKKDSKEEDEEDEDEVDLKEDSEEEDKIDLKEDETEITAPPKRKEVLAKYPKFFQDFPWMEKMMYRDRKYTETFGSFDDAIEASEKATAYETLQSSVMSGEPELFLSEIKSADAKVFAKFVDNFLPTLAKVDREAYKEVAHDVTRLLITSLAKEAKSVFGRNEELSKAYDEAAQILNSHIFGTDEFVPKKAKDFSQDDKLEQERKAFQQERIDTAVSDMRDRVGKTLRNTVDSEIDPKGEMTDFVKKNAIKECVTMIDTMIGEDTAFVRLLDKAWKDAIANKLTTSAQDKIRSMWLGRAKRFLPTALKKVRSEALKGVVRTKSSNNSGRNGPITTGKVHNPNKVEKSSGRRPGESEMDYIMRRD